MRKSLIFQRKDGPQAFSREAPVKAVTFEADGSLGRMQTLTRVRATEPIGLALAGGGTLAVWATRERLDAAFAGADGRFRGISAPAGPPPEPLPHELHQPRRAGRRALRDRDLGPRPDGACFRAPVLRDSSTPIKSAR